MTFKLTRTHVFLLLISPLFFTNCTCAKLTSRQPDIPNGGRAVAVAMSPTSNNTIVVASETGGLFRSGNQGDSWGHVSKTSSFVFRDVMFVPTDPNIVVAAANVDSKTVSGGGIYRSTDGGQNWSKATMNTPSANCTNTMAAHCLSFDTSNGRLWAGTDCGLFYSDDQGATWDFLSGATGLGANSIRAVITPAADKMVVLSGNAVRVSTTGGSSWTTSTVGLPGNRGAGQHNQIAVSKQNSQHIYFTFNFSAGGDAKNGLYYSQDFGTNWSVIVSQNGWNRPPFVLLTEAALNGGNNKIDLYYSDGGCQLRRREVIHGAIHGFGPWNNISSDHCDPADMGFATDGKTPILLASDGGVHKTTDNGASWTMAGAGGDGYAALQITEVTGQKASDIGETDLYFATQDNDIWASPDYGATWPYKRCCEGFYLHVPRGPLSGAQTTHTGVACAGCGNYSSGPVLTSQAAWNNPPRNSGNPSLIKPQFYAQQHFNLDSTAWRLARTTNTGGNWTSPVGLLEVAMNLPLAVGPPTNPIIYLAIRKPGTTNGAPNIRLQRISGFLGSTVVQSELTGYGNLGTFPTMFAWYEVFGVNPGDPNFIMVPDIENDVVRKTIDGGISWMDDANLTDLVTNSGEFKFHWDRFSQISSFGFDPECWGHIMVGTQHAGVFQTFDGGGSWEKVEGSENIPYVSSFFFPEEGEVVISSYGRGLWRFRYDCPGPVVSLPFVQIPEEPVLWSRGSLTPLKQLVIAEDCTSCGFFLLKNAHITDLSYDKESDKVSEIFIDGGAFEGYDHKGGAIPIPVKVSIGSGGNGLLYENKDLVDLLDRKTLVKGIYLEGDLLKGLVLSEKEVDSTQLPTVRPKAPIIRLNMDGELGVPISRVKNLQIVAYGLDPQFPVTIQINGNEVDIEGEGQTQFDDKGVFRFPIPPVFGVGNHEIIVRQQTDEGVIEELIDLRITVSDTPENKQ
ncbi:sialidase family protein [Flavobacteriaceae bacterium 3-367]